MTDTPITDEFELAIYKDFFDKWELFHASPPMRQIKEQRAQDLVDAANLIRNFRQPVKLAS